MGGLESGLPIPFVELSGLQRLEVATDLWDSLWLRGGFHPSLKGRSDADSVQWRRAD
jgi:hypothetical protein